MNDHYKRGSMQTIERLQELLTAEQFEGFCRGNVLKYAERAGYKGDEADDVDKLIDYARWWRQSVKGEKITVNAEGF